MFDKLINLTKYAEESQSGYSTAIIYNGSKYEKVAL